ncbi:type II secretion system protein GspL [Legionella drozanskii]|uniref:Type II secretion system protein L n=1 Tax=Legionella drozanskii LLAP-1 TaxID=1212489 RepID=A0A0W0SWP6_9GAMM|nr:type II secretion system protein GspL [Legionella drozanskii]KTC87794.1 general secretion pathway protein L [Legionella drozanskii LLAP-1]PJE11202.1 MAG: general secretion pathway protein GspL [Legionella sp.]
MTTCFLFTQHLNENNCLSLRLDAKGQIDAPLAQRDFAEIKTLQTNAQTYIVASSRHFSLHQIELPWLPDRKARAAIPFALEERLAQNVDTLQFAFDRNYYQAGRYLVVVGDKNYLKELISFFDEHQINFDNLTLDWFALKPQEIAMMDSFLLINDDSFQGALSPDLMPFYLDKWTKEQTIYCFSDSDKSQLKPTEAQLIEQEESSYTWLAQRLSTTRPLNLCQGELQHDGSQSKTKRLYQAAFGMCMLWLLSVLAVNAMKIYFLNKDLNEVNEKTAVIYREFFPQSHQVISPKFRISQLLKSNQNNSDFTFWTLLDKLTKTVKENPITIEQLRFQNKTLLVTLATKNFESLAGFQAALEKEKVKVKQTQASTLNQQVVSTLELTL